MSLKAPNPGEPAYLEDGQEVDLISATSDGYVIRPVYESEDDEPHFGSPRIVRTVYSAPPVAKYQADIARLHEEQAALAEQVGALRKEKHEFEAEERARKDRLRRHDQLATLDHFLAGKISHVVTHDNWDNEVTVHDAATAVEGERPYSDLRLLVLKGRKGTAGVTWNIEESSRSVIPCTSEEEAVTRAADLIAQSFEAKRKGPHGLQAHALDGLSRSCARLKLPLPEDVQAVLRANRAATAAEALRKAEAALELARADAAKWPVPAKATGEQP